MQKIEIIKLTKEIQAVKDIFISVSNLVVQQGEIIDRIDCNIEQTMNFVDSVNIYTYLEIILFYFFNKFDKANIFSFIIY